MRFLLDVNIGSRIALALTEAGHDVLRMALHNAAAEDPEILALAVDEQRILVTCDRDFSELVFARKSALPPGVIFLRFRARDVAMAVEKLMSVLDFDTLKDHMTVIDERRVRSTPFPASSNDNV